MSRTVSLAHGLSDDVVRSMERRFAKDNWGVFLGVYRSDEDPGYAYPVAGTEDGRQQILYRVPWGETIPMPAKGYAVAFRTWGQVYPGEPFYMSTHALPPGMRPLLFDIIEYATAIGGSVKIHPPKEKPWFKRTGSADKEWENA